jgi:hypothetical protein
MMHSLPVPHILHNILISRARTRFARVFSTLRQNYRFLLYVQQALDAQRVQLQYSFNSITASATQRQCLHSHVTVPPRSNVPEVEMHKILCVAEKPSIAKAVAGHLSGGQFQTVGGNLSFFIAFN